MKSNKIILSVENLTKKYQDLNGEITAIENLLTKESLFQLLVLVDVENQQFFQFLLV